MIKDKEYYESLDKRTLEYKEWKAEQLKETEALQDYVDDYITQKELEGKHAKSPTIEKVIGLGDVVESTLNSKIVKPLTNIVKSVIWKEGEDCNCDERKEAMNKTPILRHKVKVECLTVEEYNFMNPLLSNRQPISGKDVNRLIEIYSRIFNVKVVSSCNGCSMSKKLDELKAVLRTYE